MDATTRRALSTIADGHRTLAQAVEALLENDQTVGGVAEGAEDTQGQQAAAASPVWDPETDRPLVLPKVDGTQEERDWCSLTYLAGVFAINKRYGRGANAREIRQYALKAGYRDGRAVTAWSKGRGGTQNDPDKQRWITADGLTWVTDLALEHGVLLPDDLSVAWEAPEFRHAKR